MLASVKTFGAVRQIAGGRGRSGKRQADLDASKLSTDRGRQIDGALSRKGGTPRENTRPARLEQSGDSLAGGLRRTEIRRAIERVVEEFAGELKGANLIHDPPTWAPAPRSRVANHDPSLDEYARICGDRLNRHPQGGRSLLLEPGVCPVMPDQRHQQLRPEHASRDLHAHGRRGIRSDNDWHPDIVPTLFTAGSADRPKLQVIVLNTIPCYRASGADRVKSDSLFWCSYLGGEHPDGFR